LAVGEDDELLDFFAVSAEVGLVGLFVLDGRLVDVDARLLVADREDVDLMLGLGEGECWLNNDEGLRPGVV
jgi:hypothetical protein